MRIQTTKPYISIIDQSERVIWTADNNAEFLPGDFYLKSGKSFSTPSYKVSLGTDGNLTMRSPSGTLLWESGTVGQSCANEGCRAEFDNSGFFKLKKGSSPYWSLNSTNAISMKINPYSPMIALTYPNAAPNCPFAGTVIPHNGTVTAYTRTKACNNLGYTCEDFQQVRSCNNTVLSGSAPYASCTLDYSPRCRAN